VEVRRKWSKKSFEVTTKDLIEMGVHDSDCQIGRLQNQVSNLERMLAILIDRTLNLSEEELLKITGCEYMLEIVDGTQEEEE
jgi:hypothetical protein